jgi:hypothetical protein
MAGLSDCTQSKIQYTSAPMRANCNKAASGIVLPQTLALREAGAQFPMARPLSLRPGYILRQYLAVTGVWCVGATPVRWGLSYVEIWDLA